MSGFFDRILGRNRDASANKAKERLQFILVHDRINLSPQQLAAMREEILAVISKYVEVAVEEVDITLEQRDGRNSSIIVAEIPFSKSHDYERVENMDDDINENDDLDNSVDID
ncbi:MAG: cell division topological specificity factor MinE [Phototrophicales bacterium]